MDVHSKKTRSYNMSHVRSKDTGPEIMVRKYLFSKGFRYRKNDKRYPGSPDIVLPKYKTVIFVNGCFWHMHIGCRDFSMPKSNKSFWEKKLECNRIRDEENIKKLKNLGWNVIVVWQCEIKGNLFESRMKKLTEELQAFRVSRKGCADLTRTI